MKQQELTKRCTGQAGERGVRVPAPFGYKSHKQYPLACHN